MNFGLGGFFLPISAKQVKSKQKITVQVRNTGAVQVKDSAARKGL